MRAMMICVIVAVLFLFCGISRAEKIEKFNEFERNNEAEWIFLWSSKDVADKETDELINAAEKVKNYRLYLIDFFAERVAELLINDNPDLYDGEKIKELNNLIFECSRMDKNIRTELKIRYYVQLKNKKENKAINKINKQAGEASVVSQSNGYRVTLGTFPALDRAKDLKFNLEKELQKEKVRFNLEHVRKDYEAIKVFAGPYDTKEEAKKVLFDLRRDPSYQGAFLVRF